MKFDFQILYILVLIGLLVKRMTPKVWFGVCLLIGAWMAYNWLRG